MPAFTSSFFLHPSRRRPLAAGVAALFAVSANSAWATPPAVTNCNDSGMGSLRYAVDPANGAVSGDTIDLSGLTPGDPGCGGGPVSTVSTITLTTGAIVIPVGGDQTKLGVLTIKGPGQDALLIQQSPGSNSRVIQHNYYNGLASRSHLYLENLTVGYAHISSSKTANGGCVASTWGTVTLTNVHVKDCSASTTAAPYSGYRALGGGVFAQYGLTLVNSSISNSGAYAVLTGVRARGGCAQTPDNLDMRDSVVARCKAVGPIGDIYVRGGALEAHGNVTITGSVIANSYTSNYAGGIAIISGPAYTMTISNSSIAYNQGYEMVGGVFAYAGHVNINNSTIVHNTAGNHTYTQNAKQYNRAPGVSIYSLSGNFSLQSSIIANNTANGTQEDLSFGASTGLTFAASNNLVRAYLSDVTLPGGQGNLAQGTCPLLGHARNNGGHTYTAAPQSGSPVIDAGNNTANDPHTGAPALYDQRGIGFPRVSGPSADIGAHEVQKTDIVFNSEFETGCE